MKQVLRDQTRPVRHRLLLGVAAILALLWVWLANGQMLYYFDTFSYLDVGERVIAQALPAGTPQDAGTLVPQDVVPDGPPKAINAARSFVYALIVGGFAYFGLLSGAVLGQAVLTLLVAWTAARVMLRDQADRDPAPLAFLPLILCGLSALPFYVAYLMPDQMAPLGILAMALLAVAAPRMSLIELLLLWAVAALSAMVHLSNLALLTLMIPVTALAALLTGRPRWWLAPLLNGTAVLAGLAPVLLLMTLASHNTDTEAADGGRPVTFTPFITARLIVDGPGMAYLQQRCPDPGLATCRLYEALGWSDDPWRLTTTHIVFAKEPRFGSFALLPTADQIAIAQEQKRFFLEVLRAYPTGVAAALLKNTLLQTINTSVEMTIPRANFSDPARNQPVTGGSDLQPGRLSDLDRWIGFADLLHGGLYGLSALALLVLLLRPDPRLDRHARLFAAVAIAGLLANAAVCGGISQPAARYGARTAWLLPYLAMFLWVLRRGSPRT